MVWSSGVNLINQVTTIGCSTDRSYISRAHCQIEHKKCRRNKPPRCKVVANTFPLGSQHGVPSRELMDFPATQNRSLDQVPTNIRPWAPSNSWAVAMLPSHVEGKK